MNPVLAASLGPSGDEEPGDRALRIIDHHRRTTAREAIDSNSGDRKENESLDSTTDERSSPKNITWPEFVGAFIPLARTAEGKAWAKGKQQGEEGTQGRASSSGTFEAAGVGEEDLELLRVAFAITNCGGSGSDGAVSLSELRQASAELDGEEPPEEPVRRALGVSSALLNYCCGAYDIVRWVLVCHPLERCFMILP